MAGHAERPMAFEEREAAHEGRVAGRRARENGAAPS